MIAKDLQEMLDFYAVRYPEDVYLDSAGLHWDCATRTLTGPINGRTRAEGMVWYEGHGWFSDRQFGGKEPPARLEGIVTP